MTRTRCSICDDPVKADFVGSLHLEGLSLRAIADRTRHVDSPVKTIKRETIGKHITGCLATKGFEPRRPNASPVRTSAELARKTVGMSSQDVATLVQEEVVRKLQNGEARVTVQHGLQAQALLDRREERKQDRQLAITLARLLHTARPPMEAIEERIIREEGEVIEGVAVEVA